jgi:putative toxin-antitoxin system antitoxin component (TIGR02293 family)
MKMGRFASLEVLSAPTDVLIDWVHEGLPYTEIDRLGARLQLPIKGLTKILGIPERTLARRRRDGRLSPDESERVLRLDRLFSLAVAMLRDEERARSWLKSPKQALGDKPPLVYAETEIGAREVEDLMGRIRHGVLA